jgi:DNA adenine methylase
MTTPFLKWVGGKRQLLPQLNARLPAAFNDYWEPFMGGGALFFDLQERGLVGGSTAHLSDLNDSLVTTYHVVATQLQQLLPLLKAHEIAHSANASAHYYATRSATPISDLEVAARFIYLNRTCFNGLWRVNRKGEFNVPIGSYKNPSILNSALLAAASNALAGVSISHHGYELTTPVSGDFVYFDPPYDPLSKTASFTAYSKNGFGDAEQTALRDKMDALTNQGVFVMLSNSDTPFIRGLYAKHRIDSVQATRSIAASSAARASVGEVVVRNY